MKKRILALALAGTTAFSVFGAAMSANAATNSTHVFADNDAYVSYAPVAKTITSVYTGSTVTQITNVDMNMGTQYGTSFTGNETAVNTYITDHYDVKNEYVGYVSYAKVGGGTPLDLLDVDGSFGIDNAARLGGAGIDLVIGVDNTATYKVGSNVYASLHAAISAAGYDANGTHYYWGTAGQGQKTDAQYNALKSAADIRANIVSTPTGNSPATGSVTVTPVAGAANSADPLREWYFNADTTGDATINFMVYDYTTATHKSYQPTIFAYDFVYSNENTATSAANIAAVWNNTAKTNLDVAAAIGNHTLHAETGMGVPYKGVRYEVVNEWKDFLEELAIYNDGKNYYESRADFISLYKDMFYGDPVYDAHTGKLLKYEYVDLYNIEQLLKDIYALNTDAAISAANTSEMVYLMQQYKHYIGSYINVAEVETTDWGALMLSILESAEASDFKKAPDYKKYVNRVEELADAYEAATTANMIKAAEQGMYDLLTNSAYRANAANKAELNASMEALYFNVGSVPATYTVNYKTVDTNNVDYKNFTYFKAGVVKDFAIEEGFKYYSLYPQADYNELYNKVTAYTGNNANAYTGDATDEYEWFLNVYELAYNMKKGNLYQGSIDAVNEALNAAVEALEVTVTPYNSEVAAKEDMMDYIAKSVKEEADYDKNYYGMYTKAVDYADDVAEGKMQQRVAREIVAIAGDSLTWQGAQVVVTKNDMKTVKAAIADGQKALKAIKDSKDYNAAQVNALNKAIAKAQAVVDLYDGVAAATINHANTTLVADKDQIVKSDLTNAIDAINAAIDYSEIVMGWSKNAAGKWMYGKEEGYLNNGWNKIGSVWYYFNEDGTAKQSEWYKEGSKWYYFNSNAGAAIGWAKVDGDWYYFGGDNAMKTGWQKVDGNWYYLASSGKMTTGWVQVGGKWYYMSKESNSLGQMLANTTVEGYKLGADGAMIEK